MQLTRSITSRRTGLVAHCVCAILVVYASRATAQSEFDKIGSVTASLRAAGAGSDRTMAAEGCSSMANDVGVAHSVAIDPDSRGIEPIVGEEGEGGTPQARPGYPHDDSDDLPDPCNDWDGDGLCARRDNCATIPNVDQADADSDGFGDACDNCRFVANEDQADSDTNGVGNACGPCAPREVQTLRPPDGFSDDAYGYAVDVSEHTAAVGAAFSDAVYVYSELAGQWIQTAKIEPDAPGLDGSFGSSVAIHGAEMAVGDYMTYAQWQGDVYTYRLEGGAWVPSGALAVSGRTDDDEFGNDLQMEGNYLAVSAAGTTVEGRSYAGAVYVFALQDGTWVQEARITLPSSTSHDFGRAMALDSNSLLVSDDCEVYLYARNEGGWALDTTFVSPEPGTPCFGRDVALSGDTAFVVGGSFSAGAKIFVFNRRNGDWQASQILILDPWSTFFTSGYLGLALAADTAVVTQYAYGVPPLPVPPAGGARVYLFTRSAGMWTRQPMLVAPGNRYFMSSKSVALSGHTALVGFPCIWYQCPDRYISVFKSDCPPNADWEGDGDVDDVDFARLTRCLEGPAARVNSDCEQADLDRDGTVDLRDFARFSRVFNAS